VALDRTGHLRSRTTPEPTELELDVPGGFGVVDVRVTNDYGVGTLEDGFSYLERPEVSSVVPFLGPVAGGTLVTLLGKGFGPETEAEIGDRPLGAPGPGVPLLLDSTRMWGKAPSVATARWADVRITDHRGEHLLARAFRYVDAVFVFPADEVPGPVRALTSHRDGAVWAGTDEGLARIDTRADSVLPAVIASGVPEAARVNDLAVDDSGILVAATEGGVAMCKLVGQLICRTVDHRDLAEAGGILPLKTVALLPDGHLLAGGEVGLMRIDPATQDAPVLFAPGEGGGDGVPGSVVQDLAPGPGGMVWIATDGGLAGLDLASLAFTRYDAESTGGGLVDGDVRAVAIGEEGEVWVGTGSGLLRFSPDAVELPVADRWTAVSDLTGGAVTALDVDDQGRVWAVTEAGIAWVEGDPARGPVRPSPGPPSPTAPPSVAPCRPRHSSRGPRRENGVRPTARPSTDTSAATSSAPACAVTTSSPSRAGSVTAPGAPCPGRCAPSCPGRSSAGPSPAPCSPPAPARAGSAASPPPPCRPP